MSALAKAWITPHDADLVMLTLRSESVTPEYRRISCEGRLFPAVTPTNHVILLGLFSEEDLLKIKNTIEEYLSK
jgi:hypothetical protein